MQVGVWLGEPGEEGGEAIKFSMQDLTDDQIARLISGCLFANTKLKHKHT